MLAFTLLVLLNVPAPVVRASSASDCFRSVASGTWASTSTWESAPAPACTTWTAATLTPTSSAATITVRNGHTVTVGATATVDQLVVDAGGQLTVSSTLTVANGTGTDIDVSGTVLESDSTGAFTVNSGATLAFESGSTFNMANSGAGTAVPTATWDPNSTFFFSDWASSSAPSGLTGQTFGNFKLGPLASAGANRTLLGSSGGTITAAGLFSIDVSTVSGTTTLISGGGDGTINANSMSMAGGTFTAKSGGGTANVNVTGSFSQTGGTFKLRDGGTGTVAMTVGGGVSVSSGTFDFSSQSSVSATLNVAGDFTASGGTITATGTSATGSVVFDGTSRQVYTSGATVSNVVNFTVNSGAFLDMASASTVVSGGGTFTLSNGGTLGITSANGITSSGATGNIQTTTRSYSTGANYTYDGSAAQVPGNGLPATVNNLTVATTGGAIVSPTTNVSLAGNLSVSSGTLDLASFSANRSSAGGTLTVSSGATLKIGATNGFPTNYTTNTLDAASTVEYSGTSQSVGSQTYGNLTLSGSGTKTLPGALTIAGSLTTAGTAAVTATGNLAIAGNLSVSGGTLDVSTFTANRGSAGGTLTVASGATLKIGGTNTLPSNYSSHAIGATSTIEYSGTTQSVATLNSSQNYGHLTISGSGTKTLAGTVGVAGNLSVSAGTLDLATFTANRTASGGTLTVSSGATLKIGGTNGFPSNYTTHSLGATSTVEYAGTTQTVGGETYGNLTISGTGATLGGNASASGALALSGGDLSTGSGASVLTLGSAATCSGSGEVVSDAAATGGLDRLGFTTGGSALCLGNVFSTIRITAGTAPTDIAIKLVKSAPVDLTGSITREYTITANGGSGITATVRLHYLDGELNGNDETTLLLTRYDSANWVQLGATSRNTTDDWVEQTGVTAFGRMTLRSAGVTNVVFGAAATTPSSLLAGAMTTWTVGFKTSSLGNLHAADTITLVFPGAFAIAPQSLIPSTGFSHCSFGISTAGATVTLTLANSGGTCVLGNSATGTVTLSIITNPVAGSHAASAFSVATSRDSGAVSPASGAVIAAATSVSGVSFTGSPLTGGSRSTYTVDFTTGASGALAAGDTITVALDPAFAASPAVTFEGGFANCINSGGSTLGALITIKLADSGGTCGLANSTFGRLRIAGVTNPAAGSYLAANFGVWTSKDGTAVHPGSAIVIGAATSVTGVSYSGAPQAASAIATWTVGFSASGTGAMTANDKITIVFDPAFVLPANPTVTLGAGFTSCSRTATSAGSILTVTLTNSTCAASGALSLSVAGVTNPSAGSYGAPSFSVKTTRDIVAANPGSAVVIAASSGLSAVSFAGTPQTGGATARWAAGFTTSASGALSAGDKVSLVFNASFGVAATPTVSLGAGFSSCTATATGSGTTVTVTLAGASCSVGNSTAASLTVGGITNPAAGSYTANTFSVATSKDQAAVSLTSAVTIAAATGVSAVSFSGSNQVAGTSATWTVGFTTSASGALAAGDKVTVVFNSSFPALSTSVTPGAGFTNCGRSVALSSKTLTVTLTDSGGTCAVGSSASASLTIAGVTNAPAGSYAANTFSVKTTKDTVAANPGSAVGITAATSVTGVTFSGTPQTGDARATWTVGFTTSASGALAAGDKLTIVFNASFPSLSTTVTLGAGYTNCGRSVALSSKTLTITLTDSGGTCAVASSASASLVIAGVTNAPAGSYAANTFSVKTTRDSAAANPALAVVITAASSVTAVTFSGASQVHAATTTWTVHFTTTASGALSAGDKVTVVFNSSFSLSTSVTLGSGFSGCSRSVARSGTTLTITLSGASCTVANSSAATLTVASVVNPAAGTYLANTFSVKTTKDTVVVSPASNVVIS